LFHAFRDGWANLRFDKARSPGMLATAGKRFALEIMDVSDSLARTRTPGKDRSLVAWRLSHGRLPFGISKL
jgi:hypothetical protein